MTHLITLIQFKRKGTQINNELEFYPNRLTFLINELGYITILLPSVYNCNEPSSWPTYFSRLKWQVLSYVLECHYNPNPYIETYSLGLPPQNARLLSRPPPPPPLPYYPLQFSPLLPSTTVKAITFLKKKKKTVKTISSIFVYPQSVNFCISRFNIYVNFFAKLRGEGSLEREEEEWDGDTLRVGGTWVGGASGVQRHLHDGEFNHSANPG